MGILDSPFHVSFSRTAIPSVVRKEAMFTLTNLGRQQAEQLEGDETEFSILATMMQRRAWSISDLSKETHMGPEKITFELKRLMRQNMVKTIGASGE